MKARVIAVCICAPDCTAIVAKVAYEIADIQVSILIKVKVIRMNVMKEVRLENLPLALPFRTDDEYSPCLEICCENVTVLMDGKSNHAGILVAPDYRLLPFGGDLHDLRPGTFALAEQQIAISIEDRAFRGVARPKILKLNPWLGNHRRQSCDIWRKRKIRDARPLRYQIWIDAHYFPFRGFA